MNFKKMLKIISLFTFVLLLAAGCDSNSISPDIENKTVIIIDTLSMMHLGHYNSVITKTIPFGNTPRGFRVDIYFEGTFSGEKINGKMEGIDYFLSRPDGVSEINAYATLTTDDNATITVHITGLSYENGDIKDSYVKMESGYSNYSWLNNTVITGAGKSVTDTTFSVDYYYYP